MKTNIIYKVVNTITEEVYIGATTRSLEERKADHYQKANKKVGSYFQEAIGTYGAEAFSWEQIDTAENSNELAEKESKYIYDYKLQGRIYNSDKGGGIKKTVYKYNLDGTLNDTFEDLTSASNTVDVRKQDISRACWSVNNLLGGFLWSYEYREPFIPESDGRKKTVNQISLDGDLIDSYESASEASRITGISKTCITRCCRGERKQSGGFVWEYL